MRSQDGFSLLEVCFVLAIALVLSAISIPNMAAVVSNARLHAGVSSISGLLQNGRMIAVKKNKAMSVHFEAEDASIVGYVKEVLDTSERTGSDMQAQWEDPVKRRNRFLGRKAQYGGAERVRGVISGRGHHH